MASNEGNPFDIDRLPSVDEQIKALASRAKGENILGPFLECMKRVIFNLRNSPLIWGDPLSHTKKEGGIVFRGIEKFVVVQYVVFENENLVCVLKMEPLDIAWPPK